MVSRGTKCSALKQNQPLSQCTLSVQPQSIALKWDILTLASSSPQDHHHLLLTRLYADVHRCLPKLPQLLLACFFLLPFPCHPQYTTLLLTGRQHRMCLSYFFHLLTSTHTRSWSGTDASLKSVLKNINHLEIAVEGPS